LHVAVDDQAQAEHRQLLAGAMSNALARQEAASRNPGVGFQLDSEAGLSQPPEFASLPRKGEGFGDRRGWGPRIKQQPFPAYADEAVSGITHAGAAVTAPGSREVSVSLLAYMGGRLFGGPRGGHQMVNVGTAAHRSGVEYVDVGEPAGGGLVGWLKRLLRRES
jgi:hypothetical protein